MRRPTFAIVVACTLSVAGAAVVSAQEASPGLVSSGGRVEVPEAGFALTFPEGWVLLTRESLFDESVLEGIEQADPAYWELVREPAARLEAGDALKLFATPSDYADYTSTIPACSVVLQPSEGATLAEVVEAQVWLIETQMSDFLVFGPEVQEVALSAGEALRIDIAHSVGTGGWASNYFIADDSVVYGLTCVAESPPEDRWLSIAETFEFLPEEE